MFVDAVYLYCEVYATVRYNTNITTLKPSDISTITAATVSKYNTDNLDGFKKTIRSSKLAELINNQHPSVISCDLSVSPFKTFIPTSGVVYKQIFDFGFRLAKEYTISYDDLVKSTIPAIRSTTLIKDGKNCYIKDDGNGVLGLYTVEAQNGEIKLNDVGTVDYNNGKATINNLVIDSFIPASGPHAHLYAVSIEKDISSTKNQILVIRDSDIELDIISLQV